MKQIGLHVAICLLVLVGFFSGGMLLAPEKQIPTFYSQQSPQTHSLSQVFILEEQALVVASSEAPPIQSQSSGSEKNTQPASEPEQGAAATVEAQESSSQPEKPKNEKEILPLYESKSEVFPNMMGWISLPGTLIDLPVMYTPEDPEFYATHFYNGQPSHYGAPFIDARCTLEPRSTNLIIHGNYMSDGTMFNALSGYLQSNFYGQHPRIRFDTLYEQGVYEVLSVFTSQTGRNATELEAVTRFVSATSRQEFDRFTAGLKTLSRYDTGVSASYGDSFLTLVAHDYPASGERLYIVAKKI